MSLHDGPNSLVFKWNFRNRLAGTRLKSSVLRMLIFFVYFPTIQQMKHFLKLEAIVRGSCMWVGGQGKQQRETGPLFRNFSSIILVREL